MISELLSLWAAEKKTTEQKEIDMKMYFVGLLKKAMLVALVLSVIDWALPYDRFVVGWSQQMADSHRSPWIGYAIDPVAFVVLSAFAIFFWQVIERSEDYAFMNRMYALISVALCGTVFINGGGSSLVCGFRCLCIAVALTIAGTFMAKCYTWLMGLWDDVRERRAQKALNARNIIVFVRTQEDDHEYYHGQHILSRH